MNGSCARSSPVVSDSVLSDSKADEFLSPVTVALREIGSVLRLSVENIGKNIPDDMKDKIWSNAFTTSDEGKNNTGLGLFIVKEISLIELTDCGFENLNNGDRFWFDFVSYEEKEK